MSTLQEQSAQQHSLSASKGLSPQCVLPIAFLFLPWETCCLEDKPRWKFGQKPFLRLQSRESTALSAALIEGLGRAAKPEPNPKPF